MIGNKMTGSELRRLKDRLSLLFRSAFEQRRNVILLCDGNDLLGLQRFVQTLMGLLDPRHYRVYRDNAAPRGPFLLPWWRALPPGGDLLILPHSYCHRAVVEYLNKDISKNRFSEILEEIEEFERSQFQQGCLVYHLAFMVPSREFKKQMRKIGSRPVEDLLAKTEAEIARAPRRYIRSMERIFLSAAEEPWFKPELKKYARLEVAMLRFLVARLEEDLQVDSAQATAVFDEAMEALRGRRPGHAG
ncbi:MAG: hypothetical protein HS115_05550 [Spirochaetales bacterium]|nr:hypothetical protein [Spirochaetales bacterium]